MSVGYKEVVSRLRFVPASHGPHLQDGHSFNASELRPTMRGYPLHATSVDPQFLPQHGNFGFQLVDSGVFRMAILDQSFTASEHGDSHDPDDIEHRISSASFPVPLEEAMLPYPACNQSHIGALRNHPP